MAEVATFPDCCGFKIINKFQGGHPASDPNDCIDKETLNIYLEKQEQVYYNKIAGLIAVLSEPQEERIGSVFRSRKWKLIVEIDNPRTNTRLYMYLRDLNHTEARHKRVFGR